MSIKRDASVHEKKCCWSSHWAPHASPSSPSQGITEMFTSPNIRYFESQHPNQESLETSAPFMKSSSLRTWQFTQKQMFPSVYTGLELKEPKLLDLRVKYSLRLKEQKLRIPLVFYFLALISYHKLHRLKQHVLLPHSVWLKSRLSSDGRQARLLAAGFGEESAPGFIPAVGRICPSWL